jgi:hypothetical protein
MYMYIYTYIHTYIYPSILMHRSATNAGEREMTRHAHAVLGNTPLHVAAKEDRIDDVTHLLSHSTPRSLSLKT